MAATTVIELGAVTLTRVVYVDVAVPPDVVGLTADDLGALGDDERWVTNGQVGVAAAAWVVSVDGQHVVIDPFGNADEILHDPDNAAAHQAAISGAFDAAGIPTSAISRVVVSHIEGIGFNAIRRGDGWAPFFTSASIRVGEAALANLERAPDHWTVDAWRALVANGHVDTFNDGETLLPGMVAEHTGAHNPGHYVFHFGDDIHDSPQATAVGHLAVSPLHLATGPCIPQHDDPDLAWRLLRSFADDGRVVFGPLWPSPGAGRWVGGHLQAVG